MKIYFFGEGKTDFNCDLDVEDITVNTGLFKDVFNEGGITHIDYYGHRC